MSAILSRRGVLVTAQLNRREMRLAVSLVGPTASPTLRAHELSISSSPRAGACRVEERERGRTSGPRP